MTLTALRVGAGTHGTALLHGYLGSGRNLWSLARAWSARDPERAFVLPDLTGHGDSPPLTPEADLRSVARDVLQTLAKTELAPPYSVVGHSLGGRVALAMLDVDAAVLRDVTLLDISPSRIGFAGHGHTLVAEAFARVPATFPRREDARTALESEGLAKPMADWLLTNLKPQADGFGWRVDRQALLDMRPLINAMDLWSVAERYADRIRCVRGGRSDYVSDEDVARLRALGCSVTTIEDAGHFIHVDQPARLVELLAAG
jgi:pimeloyl-ACP methyl ester carboxylesterase